MNLNSHMQERQKANETTCESAIDNTLKNEHAIILSHNSERVPVSFSCPGAAQQNDDKVSFEIHRFVKNFS